MNNSALGWTLDALCFIAIVVNLSCVVILRRKTAEVERLLDKLREGRELQMKALQFLNDRAALYIPADDRPPILGDLR